MTGPRHVLVVVAAAISVVASPAAAINFVSNFTMSQAEEIPPTGSTATGSGQVVLDTLANKLTYTITYSGLEGVENGAHIHGPANPGQNALPQHFLPPGSIKQGVWNYSPGFESDLLAGRFYVNIHSDLFPNGEIRGQITPLVALPVFPAFGAGLSMIGLAGLALAALRRRSPWRMTSFRRTKEG